MISRIKKLLNISSDKELATYFDIAPSVVAAWKRRENVPVEYCIKVAQDTGSTLDYIVLGKENVQIDDVILQELQPFADENKRTLQDEVNIRLNHSLRFPLPQLSPIRIETTQALLQQIYLQNQTLLELSQEVKTLREQLPK